MSLVIYTVDVVAVSGFSGTGNSGWLSSLPPSLEQADRETDMVTAIAVRNNFKFIIFTLF